jgi:class 3 adenylate cyclase
VVAGRADDDDIWARTQSAVIDSLSGNQESARSTAERILEMHPSADNLDEARARLLASLIAGEGASAGKAAEALRHHAGNAYTQIVPVLQTLNELAAAGVSVSEDVEDKLAPPRVVVFSGPDLDRPNRQRPCFPEQAEPAMIAAIERSIDALDPQIGYTTLAAGSSLLFAEAMLRRGRELHVVLPFRLDDVRAEGVAWAGEPWVERFERCIAGATSIEYATRGPFLGHGALFRFGNQMLHGLATLRSRFLGTEPYLLAFWDYLGDTLAGGAAEFIDQWGDIARLRIVDLDDVVQGVVDALPSSSHGPELPSEPGPRIEREVRVMLFADIVNYSKLGDEHLPLFLRAMSDAADHLRARFDLDFVASWGDALFFVMDEATAIAGVALELSHQIALFSESMPALPFDLSIRIALDAGPVYPTADPFTRQPNYWGFHINRAARLEPITVPGQVYATQPFVALLALEESVKRSEALQAGIDNHVPPFSTAYVGRLTLSKGFSEEAIYHIRRRDPVRES